MGIGTKGRRRIVCDDRTYVWSVAPDDDSPYRVLRIHSEDKRFALCCPLQTPVPYVIDQGATFQGVEPEGPRTYARYRLPFAVPDPITPRFVATLIRWATTGDRAVRIEWDGTDVPI